MICLIVADEGGRDILLHANVLRNFGQSSIADGAAILVKALKTPRGQQAIEVLEIAPPPGVQMGLQEDADAVPEDYSDLPLEPARVKWFDKDKGLASPMSMAAPRMFVHFEVLRVSGFADLQAGEAVSLRVVEGNWMDGRAGGVMGKCVAALVWCLALLACSGAVDAACAPGAVELRWQGGQARFSVDIADTDALREKGLMFRDHMAAAQGMLFVYSAPEHAYYWMKNTLIPLDMVFADQTGRVTVVHSNAAPGDLTPIDGGEGVAYVLEINGGLAARMGIVPGSEMRTALMDQSLARWSCAQ